MTLLNKKILDNIGRSETLGPVFVLAQDICKYSIATGQTFAPYLAGKEAPPLFFMSLPWKLHPLSELAEDGLPDDPLIPPFPLEKRMGGGMRVEASRSIVPGDVLTAERTLVEIREKQGRSGPLIFYTTRLDIADIDKRTIIRNFDERIVR